MEEKRDNFDEIVDELSSCNTNESIQDESKKVKNCKVISENNQNEEDKIFKRFKIKDIVFLAIISAIMLLSGAFMPLVANIPLFGIIELCLGLQFSLFPAIGMMKVRKPGSLLFMSFFSGIVLIFMNTIMFFCLLLCALISEGLTLLIFRGYKSDWASFFASTIYMPLTLPFLYLWYKFFYSFTGEEGEAVSAFIGSDVGTAIGMSIAVIALCALGAFIGVIITRELKKAGVIKK